jgi:hypothetical protein
MRAWFVVICLWAGVVGAAVYPGNGNSGFGGPIGGGTLEITNDAFNLYFTLTRGGMI